MSGGAFEYNQYKIRQIWEKIQEELDKQEREDVQQIFKDGIEILKKAEVYAQRIDWYLSGDDGEDSLVSRLESDLNTL